MVSFLIVLHTLVSIFLIGMILMQASQGKQNGQFTLRGQDLILALERAGDFRARITG